MAADDVQKVQWLTSADPPENFPDPCRALQEPNGLLAIGGDLSPERLLYAYAHGIFPWYQDDQPILWWSPNPRAVLFPTEFHVSRSLRRTVKREAFLVSVDQNFSGVIRSCAETRADTGTWITPDMHAAFRELHRLGYAHSVEIWRDNNLVGGVYGINIGGVFFAESMFSRETDASKVALLRLTRLCREFRIGLIDCQVASLHLASLGSREISRAEFQQLLARLTTFLSPDDWQRPIAPVARTVIDA